MEVTLCVFCPDASLELDDQQSEVMQHEEMQCWEDVGQATMTLLCICVCSHTECSMRVIIATLSAADNNTNVSMVRVPLGGRLAQAMSKSNKHSRACTAGR